MEKILHLIDFLTRTFMLQNQPLVLAENYFVTGDKSMEVTTQKKNKKNLYQEHIKNNIKD